jgi:regulator of replication initiation timing
MTDSGSQLAKLKTALRWLYSHHKRLSIEKKSLEDRLAETTKVVERLDAEIKEAENRLRRLTRS